MTDTPRTVLVFGAIGTQLIVDSRMYEIVVISDTGAVTWRGKCVVCRAAIFVETRDGKLPAISRCTAHRVADRHPALPALPEPPRAQEVGIMAIREFLPRPRVPIDAIIDEQFTGGVESVAYVDQVRTQGLAVHPGSDMTEAVIHEVMEPIRSVITHAHENIPGAAPLFGNVTVQMGDEDNTMISTEIDREPYSLSAMAAELDAMAPSESDHPPAPLDDDQIWEPRLRLFMQHKMWDMNAWGPRPDQPGCTAPEHLLDAMRGRRG